MSKDTLDLYFLHGWGGSGTSLQPLAQELIAKLSAANKTANTIVLEFPGHGSTPLPSAFKFRDYVNFAKNEISPGNRILIGHSFGGKVLLKLLAEGYFNENDRLILISSNGLEAKLSTKRKVARGIAKSFAPIKKITLGLGFRKFYKFGQKFFYKFFVGARDYEKTTENPMLRETFLNVIAENINVESLMAVPKEQLPKVLLLWGAKDAATPVWMGKALNVAISGSELYIFPNATHGLPLHQPGEVASKITEFILQEEINEV